MADMVSQITGQDRPGPLSGLLVADFARVLAGPYCTMLLADLGADVIKVESPAGDDTRRWVPPTRDGVATYYLAINRNKRSVVLDLGTDEGLAAAHELTRRADIMVQNFKPGGLKRFGLDYPAVQARNPGIVYASISGFGAGAGQALPGYDVLVQAMSGLMSLTGDPDGPPYRAGISLVDILAGLHATVGILAAVAHRAQTGDGQHVEVNLLSSALSGMANQSSAYVAGGVVPMRMGNLHPSLTPYEPLPTGDGDLVIAVGNDRQFAPAVRGARRAWAGQRPAVRAERGPHRHRAELRAELAERLAARTSAEWFDAARRGRHPVRPDQHGGRRRGHRGRAGPGAHRDARAASPASGTRSRCPPPRPTTRCRRPTLDEHGDQIRAWLAGATAAIPPGSQERPDDRSVPVPGLSHLARRLGRRLDHRARP